MGLFLLAALALDLERAVRRRGGRGRLLLGLDCTQEAVRERGKEAGRGKHRGRAGRGGAGW